MRLLLVSEGGGEETFTGLVVSYVATLRQGLEQEFIQFRACGGVAPHDLVSRACLHQADKNLQSWCMSRPAMRSEPLLEWSRALADGPLKEVLLQRFEFEAIVDAATWEVRFIEGPVHSGSVGQRRRCCAKGARIARGSALGGCEGCGHEHERSRGARDPSVLVRYVLRT